MSSYQGTVVKHTKRQETQFEEIEQVSETEMAEILELSHWKYIKKKFMIIMLGSLMEKVDSIQ